MPWESKTVEEKRIAFVITVQKEGNMSAVCREFGISRRTGYKWLKRYEAGENMSDRSRAPTSNSRRISSDIEEKILKLRTENPGWGAKTLKRVLEDQGETDIPCAKTVNNILLRNGCISAENSEKRIPYIRFEKERCNEMWQTDFKGEFLMKNGRYCYPLDIIDDHTRFLIQITPTESTANFVIGCFERAFREYGLPDSILSDNGAQFAGFRHGFTKFEKWLMNHDVLPIHERIRHPQTQGKIERFHRTLKEELLAHTKFEDIIDADNKLQLWREKYNTVRPHSALNMQCPAQVYTPSQRLYIEEIKPYEYSGEFRLIKVNNWGYIRFDKWQIYLSETMSGERIEIRPDVISDSFNLCYRNFRIASISAIDGSLIHRKISRL